MNETKELIEFVRGIQYDDLSAEVVETAKMSILDTVGVGLYGSLTEWSNIVAEFVKENACAPESSVWGQNWKTSAPYAALINGTSAHGIEMDDQSTNLSIHCGAAVIPAALAVWEKTRTGGKDVIITVVALVHFLGSSPKSPGPRDTTSRM